MSCSIYIITNKYNNKVYVGQTWKTIAERFRGHKKPSKKGCINLHNALNKYGRDNFKIECIAACSDQETADYLEIFYIKEYDSVSNGYNLHLGGQGHRSLSAETKAKISKSLTGKKRSEATRKKLSIAFSGEKNGFYGKTQIPWNKGKTMSQIPWNKGKAMSQITKNKISQSRIARIARLTKEIV